MKTHKVFGAFAACAALALAFASLLPALADETVTVPASVEGMST